MWNSCGDDSGNAEVGMVLIEQFDFKGIDFRASKNGRRRDECMVRNERNIAAQTRIQVARERKVQRGSDEKDCSVNSFRDTTAGFGTCRTISFPIRWLRAHAHVAWLLAVTRERPPMVDSPGLLFKMRSLSNSTRRNEPQTLPS